MENLNTSIWHQDKNKAHRELQNWISPRDFSFAMFAFSTLKNEWKEWNQLARSKCIFTMRTGASSHQNAIFFIFPATNEHTRKTPKKQAKNKYADIKKSQFHTLEKSGQWKEIRFFDNFFVMRLERLCFENALKRCFSNFLIHISQNRIFLEKIWIERA